jgi:hypothetical protein
LSTTISTAEIFHFDEGQIPALQRGEPNAIAAARKLLLTPNIYLAPAQTLYEVLSLVDEQTASDAYTKVLVVHADVKFRTRAGTYPDEALLKWRATVCRVRQALRVELVSRSLCPLWHDDCLEWPELAYPRYLWNFTKPSLGSETRLPSTRLAGTSNVS